jgi:hypothetical protein
MTEIANLPTTVGGAFNLVFEEYFARCSIGDLEGFDADWASNAIDVIVRFEPEANTA